MIIRSIIFGTTVSETVPGLVNRTEELSRLSTLYTSDEAELAVIFG